MWLSDHSVKRPVFATVVNLLVIAFGILSFTKLPLREYPDIDPPIVSVDTAYQGASANVVETRITQVLEDRISGIEGIKSIQSQSEDGRSRITVEFSVNRDIDDAANDIRDRISGAIDNLPDEADPPDIQKANSDEQVIMWLNLQGKGMDIMALTDYAQRYIQDRFSAIDGVARVRVGGGKKRAMRIWLDKNKLAARNLTVADVEAALRSENVELPAGALQSVKRDFTMRVDRTYRTVDDFNKLVLSQGEDRYLIRLGDVARIEIGAVEDRATLRGNTIAMVGIGIVKQSKANTLDVARAAIKEMEQVNATLPVHMSLEKSYDSSIFIDNAIDEVFKTLFITVILVVFVIYVFLGSFRAMLVPAVTVPVCLIGAFTVLYAFGFTINLLTLLALVLAIGLVVDDAIVVIENIYRRLEYGESPLVAAYRGTRQVGFAVIATTMVLVAVFVPITFLGGDIGRLFTEFSITMAAAVVFSSFVALSCSPMMASKLMGREQHASSVLTRKVDQWFEILRHHYVKCLQKLLGVPWLVVGFLAIMGVATVLLARTIASEYAPQEDRGAFYISIRGPEGASYAYVMEHLLEVEKRLLPFVESGEFQRMLMRAPASFGGTASFNDARGIIVLSHWDTGRKPMRYYMQKVQELTADLAGVRVSVIARQAFGSGEAKPVQFVLGGPTYEDLSKWRDIIMRKAAENPGLIDMVHDFYETKPQIAITVNRDRAGALGVPVRVINTTLETLMGSRRVTTYIDGGEEYDVIVESERDLKQTPADIGNTYVRSERSGQLIPLSNLVTLREFAGPTELNRYNRVRAITLQAGLADGYSLGEALAYLEDLVRTELPSGASIDYKGASQDYIESGDSVYLVFVMALLIVFLVLAGQFESFVHPLVIMITVPLATTGALLGLWLTGLSLNIYSQIGLIILIGLSAKNGILIVEFINQLRDEGVAFADAVIEASTKRLRPIIMTALTTAMGSIPLIVSSGAGQETRLVIGVVILAGVIVATFFTVFVVPVIYSLLAKNTSSPDEVTRKLESQLQDYKEQN